MTVTKKIETITNEQVAKFPDYIRKWISIGVDTTPLNMDRLKVAVKYLYECAGLVPPSEDNIIIVDSPLHGVIKVNADLYKHAHPKATRAEVIAHLQKNCEFVVGGFGQHDASWCAFYDFFRTECGLTQETEKLKGLDLMAKEACWYWPYEDRIYVSRKPTFVHLNDANVLHCDTGPCIGFADGFMATLRGGDCKPLYKVNDVEVPEFVIMRPETITLNHIESEENAEVRRIMIEKYGVTRYLEDIKASIVDMDMVPICSYDPNSGSMPRALISDKSKNQFLVGTDGSTKRTYYMALGQTSFKTCAEAHTAIAGVDDSNIIANS